MVGQVSFANVRLGTRRRESGGILQVSRNLGFVWVLSGRRSPVTPLLGIYGKGSHLVNPGSLVTRVANKSTWHGNRAPIRPESTDTQFRPTVSGVAPERLLVSKNRPHRPHRSSAFRRTGSSFRRTGSIALVERSQGRAYQNDGLVDASAVTRHNLVQTYTDETFSTPLRFVPNLGYCATFSTRRNGNSKPVDHLNIRHVYPAHPWSRSGLTGAGVHAQGRFVERDHLDGATELPDRQAKALQGRWHLQPVVATYRQMAPSLGSSPDCLLFASFPFRSLLQGHQGRYLDTDPFPQVRLLAPFDTGSLLHRGGFKVAPEQQGPKRLAGEAPTSVARPQRLPPSPRHPLSGSMGIGMKSWQGTPTFIGSQASRKVDKLVSHGLTVDTSARNSGTVKLYGLMNRIWNAMQSMLHKPYNDRSRHRKVN